MSALDDKDWQKRHASVQEVLDENAKLREQLAAKDEDLKKWSSLQTSTAFVAELAQQRAAAAEAKLKAESKQEPDIYVHNDGSEVWGAAVNPELATNSSYSPYWGKPIPIADVHELQQNGLNLNRALGIAHRRIDKLNAELLSQKLAEDTNSHIQAQRIAELERRLAEQQAAAAHAYVTLNACEESDTPTHGVSEAGRILAKIDCTQLEVLLAQARGEGRKEAVPDGWQAVPVVLTRTMRIAGAVKWSTSDAWEAMLSAAPKPEVK